MMNEHVLTHPGALALDGMAEVNFLRAGGWRIRVADRFKCDGRFFFMLLVVARSFPPTASADDVAGNGGKSLL